MSLHWHNFVSQSKRLLWMATRIVQLNIDTFMQEAAQPRAGDEQQLPALEMLKSIMQTVNETNVCVREIMEERAQLKKERDALASVIHIDQEMMQKIFGVSKRTLQRWRDERRIPYHITSTGGYCYYQFSEVEVALRRGTISCKGTSQTEAIARLGVFYEGVKQGKSIDDIYAEFD